MMNEDQIFKQLEAVLKELSIEIKFRKGYFRGGLCRYRGKNYLYLNRLEKTDSHIDLIISELSKMDLQGIILSQDIEELLLKVEASRED
jgi:hypothetical protein